ncbi:MAG: hypothetical protein LIP09_14200 [Bacteroidales bacterium]|nr:hypothetical protein [Bacteroidales bacterium]MCC8119880.1 hypothetical protein [Bacteroidales bacterium]
MKKNKESKIGAPQEVLLAKAGNFLVMRVEGEDPVRKRKKTLALKVKTVSGSFELSYSCDTEMFPRIMEMSRRNKEFLRLWCSMCYSICGAVPDLEFLSGMLSEYEKLVQRWIEREDFEARDDASEIEDLKAMLIPNVENQDGESAEPQD